MSLVVDTLDFLATGDNWTGPRGILARGRSHLWISLVAATMAAAIALPSAVLLAHREPVHRFAVVTGNGGTAGQGGGTEDQHRGQGAVRQRVEKRVH